MDNWKFESGTGRIKNKEKANEPNWLCLWYTVR